MEKIPRVPALGQELELKKEYSSNLDDAYLYKLVGRDDVIIRPLDWIYHLERGHFRPDWNGTSISADEFAAISKKHFDELASYGVRVPASFIVADRHDAHSRSEEVFAVVDDISKNNDADRRARGNAFLELRRSLLRYYTDKFERGQSYLADLAEDTQYVFGKKAGDTEDHVYLVDVEPYIFKSKEVLVQKVLNRTLNAAQKEASYYQVDGYEEVEQGFADLLERVKQSL